MALTGEVQGALEAKTMPLATMTAKACAADAEAWQDRGRRQGGVRLGHSRAASEGLIVLMTPPNSTTVHG